MTHVTLTTGNASLPAVRSTQQPAPAESHAQEPAKKGGHAIRTLTVESSDAVANLRSVHEKDAARTESPCARIAWPAHPAQQSAAETAFSSPGQTGVSLTMSACRISNTTSSKTGLCEVLSTCLTW